MTGAAYIAFLEQRRDGYAAKAAQYRHAPNAEVMDTYAALHMMYSGLETGLAMALSLYTPNVEASNETVPS